MWQSLRPRERLARAAAGSLTRIAAWTNCAAGVAAIEFAMVLPVMVAMLLGMTEVTLGVNMDRKLTLVSRSLADLASRTPAVATNDMANMFTAASAIMQPYDSTNVQMVVSSILVTQDGTTYTGKVDWSCAKNIPTQSNPANLSKRGSQTLYPVPTGFQGSQSFILVETLLPYRPVFGYSLTGVINLAETTPWPVRNVSKVTGPSSC